MGIQKKILTRQEIIENVPVVKNDADHTAGTETLKAELGTLALGKLGDVIATAYGPVTKAYTLTTETAFGKFIEGQGIVVNSDDVAGVGSATAPFDTKTAKSGQVVSVLVSGGAVIDQKDLATLDMNVVATIGEDEAVPFDASEWEITETEATTQAEYDGTKSYAKNAEIKVNGKVAKAKNAITRLVGVIVNGLTA